MKYRNTKTGAVIESEAEVHGENWEEVNESKEAEKPVKRTKKKEVSK